MILAGLDGENGAGDEGGARADQKGDQLRDILRRADAAERVHLAPRLDHEVLAVVTLPDIGGVAKHGRVDRAGADRVDADVLLGVVERHRPGEGIDRALARGVGGHARLRGEGLDGGDVDDRAAAPLFHVRNGEARGQVHPLHVRVEDLVPGRLIRLDDRAVALNPGAIDENVDPAVCRDCLVDQLLHVGGASHVRRHAGDRQPFAGHLLDRRVDMLLASAADQHGRAALGEEPGARLAHAERTARYDRDLASKFRATHRLPPITRVRIQKVFASRGPNVSAVSFSIAFCRPEVGTLEKGSSPTT